MITAHDLAQLLPHRPPFLLIDRLRQVDLGGGRLIGERLLGADDPLAGAALPSLLVVEALCQAAACLNGLEQAQGGAPQRHRGYLVSAAGFEFLDEARAGERLVLDVRREGRMGQMVSFQAEAWAEPPGQEAPRAVARGRLLFAVTLA